MTDPTSAPGPSRRVVVAALGFFAMALSLSVLILVARALDGGSDEEVEQEFTTTTATSTTTTSTSTTTTSTSTTTTSTTTTIPVEERVLASLIGEMSLERKAQQLVVVGGPGTDLIGIIEERMGSPCVGGIFVESGAANWAPAADPAAATTAIAAIGEGAEACAIRPFITTDAEAGTRVLKVLVAPLPSPATLVVDHLADAESPEPGRLAIELEAAAARFAADLRALGVHVNLGVIADVDVDGDHYMARQRRSFGSDPALVTALTTAIVAGHCLSGVAPALKHFPNQGATLADPHLGDSVSTSSPDDWRTLGRVPYVDTAVPVVMTGHVRFDDPETDAAPGPPASLSREITTGWLREGLGFEGVIITDDLASMRAVLDGTDGSTAAGRAVAAIDAGADLVLFVSPT